MGGAVGLLRGAPAGHDSSAFFPLLAPGARAINESADDCGDWKRSERYCEPQTVSQNGGQSNPLKAQSENSASHYPTQRSLTFLLKHPALKVTAVLGLALSHSEDAISGPREHLLVFGKF